MPAACIIESSSAGKETIACIATWPSISDTDEVLLLLLVLHSAAMLLHNRSSAAWVDSGIDSSKSISSHLVGIATLAYLDEVSCRGRLIGWYAEQDTLLRRFVSAITAVPRTRADEMAAERCERICLGRSILRDSGHEGLLLRVLWQVLSIHKIRKIQHN